MLLASLVCSAVLQQCHLAHRLERLLPAAAKRSKRHKPCGIPRHASGAIHGSWNAARGGPPAAWFDAAVGTRLRDMLRALQHDAQQQHKRALGRITRSHAQLLAVRG